MKQAVWIAACLILGGCTMTYTDPSLSSDNPANPAAAEAAPPTRWQTLDLATTEPVTRAPAEKRMETSGHKMEGMTMPSQTTPKTDEAALKSPSSGAAVLYACPMHPEVTSDKPDQRCSKCGMKLKRVAAPKSGEAK